MSKRSNLSLLSISFIEVAFGIVTILNQRGTAPFRARARLLLLLGEQLITDEVTAAFELIKNSYDADATNVIVELQDVSNMDKGSISIRDNGIGMSKDKIITSWLELGTFSKTGTTGNRVSPGGRPYLGEKGIGRLAVHKLGHHTVITTREQGSQDEIEVTIDWKRFEAGKEDFLEDVPIEWIRRSPIVFSEDAEFKHGTQIRITSLQRNWTKKMMHRLASNIDAMTSPFAGLKKFSVNLQINDELKPDLENQNLLSVLDSATYKFEIDVKKDGSVDGKYSFYRQDLPTLTRSKRIDKMILDPDQFPVQFSTDEQRKPVCGPFHFRLYAWDLYSGDKKAVFGDASTYEVLVKPNTGVRVFRDGFRVLPYGNENDDWLNLDARRVGSFEEHVSRNQVIGMVEISSSKNPELRDKADREGLIDNEAFRDFRALLWDVLGIFETQRASDRKELKRILKRTRHAKIDRVQSKLKQIEELVESSREKENISVLSQVRNLLSEAKNDINDIIEETEEPLLVAAAIGLTYMLPTHEVRRQLQDIRRILARVSKYTSDSRTQTDIDKAWRLSSRADDIVAGISKVLQKSRTTDVYLDKIAKESEELMRERLSAQKVEIELLLRPIVVRASERLLVVVLLNLLENSGYWLGTVDSPKRKLRIIVDYLADGSPVMIVSDNGPGLIDELDVLTQPFVSHKTDGMGLGLYIVNRIAENHKARLRSFDVGEIPNLLKGANIGLVFPKVDRLDESGK